MAARAPALVCWLFRPGDVIARELLELAAVLEMQGLIRNWSPPHALPGQDAKAELLSRIDVADVMVVFDDSEPSPEWKDRARSHGLGARYWLGVLVGKHAEAAWFRDAGIPSLPRDGEPLLGRKDRREGMLDVIRGLQEIVELRQRSAVNPASSPVMSARLDAASAPLSINDIFQLNGPPTITFVEPPRFEELKLELATMGTGLIVEGPSRVGKSTAVKKAMEKIRAPIARQIWWDGRTPPTLDELQQKLAELRTVQEHTWLFIDDFHYLAEDAALCRALAFGIKGLADQGNSRAKITLIGINPLGSSLVQTMSDLTGRYRVQRLDVEQDWQRSTKIAELIILGEQAANVRFRRREEFVISSGGSFFLAQFLCNKAAVESGVLRRADSLVEIKLGPTDVLASIQGELAALYRAPLLELAAFDLAPPPRGAGLTLLWLLSRSTEGFLPVREASLRFPQLAPAFGWFLESNLARCFREHPALRGLLYYNRAAGTLTLEDPQLKFYLRQLDWEEFALASGHGTVKFHPEDGPQWTRAVTAGATITAEAPAPTVQSSASSTPRELRVLHLSDLHFSSADQATTFYSQLHVDLRNELGVEKLDALIASGDIVNRADHVEYDAARVFLEQVMKGFSLTSKQLVLVPGNHDVNWDVAKKAYDLKRKEELKGSPIAGTFKQHGAEVFEVRDDDRYHARFEAFSAFYQGMKGVPYPLGYREQAIFDEPAPGLLVLGLNSAWETDHYFPDRASIHAESVAAALVKLGPPSPEQLRIAVFHHPVHSGEESRIKEAAFLQQLAVAGFRIALHGHVHKADAQLYRHDRSDGGRKLELVAAGTFGAPTREWVPGYPLQYNLLRIAAEQVTVETRKREEVNGAWSPDARWTQGPGLDPLPRYVIPR